MFAPGGDGDDANGCAPNVAGCIGNCPSAVIGPVLSPPENNDYWPTQYAYWSGTSFSTPLVSGLAALVRQASLVQAGEDNVQATAWHDSGQVADIIYCGAGGSPGGVIDARRTLIECIP